jgi:hypothetical protein
MSTYQVEAASHHRNGVAGESFNVAIIRDEEGRRMLAIDFSVYGEDDDDTDYGTTFNAAFAVVDLDMAMAGNIYMHDKYDDDANPVPGTGGNAWRGDVIAGQCRDAIRAEVARQSDLFHAHLVRTGAERAQS